MNRIVDMPYLAPFREELLASGVVLILVVTASFFTVSRLIIPADDDQNQVSGVSQSDPGLVLGQQAPTIVPTVTVAVAPPGPSPTADPLQTEVTYGQGGSYDYPEYLLEFSQPRLQFDLQTPAKRKFIVNVSLINRSVEAGLEMKVAASIMKDGNVIVPQAVFVSPEKQRLMIGEAAATTAVLSLIEGTDVKEILFNPENNLPQIIHPLKKTEDAEEG